MSDMITTADPVIRIYPYVELGDDPQIDDFVILGKPWGPPGGPDPVTHIGHRAIIRSHSVIYAGTWIGDEFRCGHHVLIRELTTIGRNVSVGSGSVIEHRVVIEDDVRLHSNVFVPEFSRLGQGCWLGPNVVLTNAKYPRSPRVKENLVGPTIKPGAKIGANVTILPGVVIGEHALVGAGSVVVKDVPDRAVVVGNPARVIKTLDQLPYGPC